MFKIIIIDDEALARIGIKSMVNWEDMDCEVLEDASNGEEGLKLIEAIKPDIVITDIKMPVMDGLEMIRKANALEKKPKYIVMSSYDDFHMVKDAMKLGAVEYLIKLDITPEILFDTVKAVCDKISAEMAESTNKQKLDMQIRISKEAARNDFFRKLVDRTPMPPKDLYESIHYLGIELSEKCLVCAVIKIKEILDDSRFQNSEDRALLEFYIENIASEVANDFFKTYILKYSKEVFILFFSPDPDLPAEERNEKVVKMGDRLLDLLWKYANTSVTIGVSNDHAQYTAFGDAYTEALRAAEYCLFAGAQGMMFVSALKEDAPNLKIPDIAIVLEEMKDAIRFCDLERINHAFEDMIRLLKKSNIHKTQAYDVCFQIAYKLREAMDENKEFHVEGLSEDESIFEKIAYLNTLANIIKWLTDIKGSIETAARARLENNQNVNLIVKAKKYIQEHYKEDLTLVGVASWLNISHCYFSTIFKQHTGENFIDYVTRVKMEEALKLLLEGRYKIYEVAEHLGYENAYYFSKVFKKLMGQTPKEYIERK